MSQRNLILALIPLNVKPATRGLKLVQHMFQLEKKYNSFKNTTTCHAPSYSSHKPHIYAMHSNIKFNHKTHTYTNIA